MFSKEGTVIPRCSPNDEPRRDNCVVCITATDEYDMALICNYGAKIADESPYSEQNT